MDGPVSMRLLPTKAVSKRGAGSRATLEDAVERVDKGRARTRRLAGFGGEQVMGVAWAVW